MKTSTLSAVCAGLLALAGCDSRDDATVGQQVDEAVASAREAAAEAKQSAERGLDEAADVTQEKGAELSKTMSDAAVTAAVKAKLAADPELSALRINVDTRNGRVSLYGSAPNDAAKQRAQQIAQAESGGRSVDNQLAIEKR